MSEFNHQCALFTWARMPIILKKYPALELLSSSLNGAHLGKAQAGKMKAAGMKKGEWDVKLPVPRGGHVGMIIEFKYGDGVLSKEQRRYGELMNEEGHCTILSYSWEIASKAIVQYLEGYLLRKY